jgi:hypothetical protein
MVVFCMLIPFGLYPAAPSPLRTLQRIIHFVKITFQTRRS